MKPTAKRVLVLACVLAFARAASAGIVSPRTGGALPGPYREVKSASKDAFTLKHAWLERRASQVAGEAGYLPARALSSTVLHDAGRALGGELSIPVVLGLYSDISVAPFTRNAFDTEFFTGPWTPGTIHQYWNEVSYGLFDVTGTVFDWVALSHPESYYVGNSQGTAPPPYGTARTGDMIKEILVALDPSVDFGAFDNDGPDGVPNSGDDDGFVDVLLVIHPTFGAECDGYSPHMWSHSWTYSSWPASGGQPYQTNDPAAGGGFIEIDDYIIVPSLSCETGIIEIGVICHELGHAIGLPDLYDWNGNSSGIGFWGLMGSGNWNTPASPAHPCAWSREQLGWLNPVGIDWRAREVGLRPVASSGDALKMPLATRRFKRTLYATGDYALICSYSDTEGMTRGWPGAGGYGNGWNESVLHEFSVDATRPVTMEFDVAIDAETGYDFGRLLLERAGAVDTLMVLTGRLSGRQPIDIGAHLPAGPCSFTLRFEFTSDESFSDEDGNYLSNPRYVFNIDNALIEGGGIDYSADFDIDSGGWRNGSEPAEYLIVENRRASGFDANLPGQGLLIWHAENSTAYTYLGNSGGASNTQQRGLVLQEADGAFDLLEPSYQGGNSGDAGDPYPGSSNNRSFDSTTTPLSRTNGGARSPASVSGIVLGSSNVSATFAGGLPAPSIYSVQPDTIDTERDAEAVLDIRGSWMQYGATAYLALGPDTVRADSVEWRGEERIVATFPIASLSAGRWNLVVVSGDGQAVTARTGIEIISLYLNASITPGRDFLLAEWTLEEDPRIRGCLLYRFENGDPTPERVTPDTLRGSAGSFSFKDSSVEPGKSYAYLIVTYLNGGGEERYILAGPYAVAWSPFVADQNYPNPFSRETTVSFFMPGPASVTIDVYDVAGRRVARLDEARYERGTQTLTWTPAAHGVVAGIYFCVFRSGNATQTIKMIYTP
jgi:M6 family metalloprotease-like protein